MKMGSVQMCYFRLVYGSRRFLLLLAVKAPSLLSIDGVMLELVGKRCWNLEKRCLLSKSSENVERARHR